MNKGIIVAFSFLVGCGAATAAYLLYTSKRGSSDDKNSNENSNENSNKNKDAIEKINAIFDKHEKNDDNNGMKDTLIDALNEGYKSPQEAIREANKFFEEKEEDQDQYKAKGRSDSIDSAFSDSSSIPWGGKRTKKSKSKRAKSKSKSKSKSKLYKKLI